jgi:hypothetical protein
MLAPVNIPLQCFSLKGNTEKFQWIAHEQKGADYL